MLQVMCSFCHKGLIPANRWYKRCELCKGNNVDKSKSRKVSAIQNRDPSAIIETESGAKVFVDKYGKEVDNPGYDLQNDSHGRDYTHTREKFESQVIL